MAVHVRFKNEFTEDEKYHNLMSWLSSTLYLFSRSGISTSALIPLFTSYWCGLSLLIRGWVPIFVLANIYNSKHASTPYMVMLKTKKHTCAYIFCLYMYNIMKMFLPLFQNDREGVLYLWHAKLVNHVISEEKFPQIFCLKYLINEELDSMQSMATN